MMDGGMNGCWDRNMVKRFDGLLRNRCVSLTDRLNVNIVKYIFHALI